MVGATADVDNRLRPLTDVEKPLMLLPSATLSHTAAAIALSVVALASGSAAADLVVGEEQAFVDKRYDIGGDWSVVEEGDRTLIRFGDDFETRNGPDLKVFLSPTTIGNANGDNATDGSLLLGELEAVEGTQDYVLPDGVSLTDFHSVLVHCEEFGVLWGGGAL